jgi:hypothetical protein
LSYNYHKRTSIHNSLNLKQNISAFSSHCINNADIIAVNLSAYEWITDRQTSINLNTIFNVLSISLKQEIQVQEILDYFQELEVRFLNIEFNANHFKDVPVEGLINRRFDLNESYANLQTSKNNVITWTFPLTYNTSIDTASINLSLLY